MILSTKNLNKRYGSHLVLNNVNLEVGEGSVYGLVGPNGAGKTTLLSILANVRRASSGEINLSVNRNKVAVCPDVPEFEPWLTALEVMQLSANLVGSKKSDAKLKEMLVSAGLSEDMNRRVGGFSRGMTQRLALASTIVGDPKLVILDEPCSALDPAGRVEVLDMVANIGHESTVIFSSHILADVQRVCDSIGVLNEGKLLYQGNLNEFLDKNIKPIWNIRLRNNPDNLVKLLLKQEWVVSAKQVGVNKVEFASDLLSKAELNIAAVLAAAKVEVVSLEPLQSDLEHAFLELTKEAK